MGAPFGRSTRDEHKSQQAQGALQLFLYLRSHCHPRPYAQSESLNDAISSARALMVQDEGASLVEIRRRNRTICTVGRGWISKQKSN